MAFARHMTAKVVLEYTYMYAKIKERHSNVHLTMEWCVLHILFLWTKIHPQ